MTDRGRERLAEKRAERARLPGLDVARAPVVEQHGPEDVVERALDRDRLAVRARPPDHEAQLELDVEAPGRAELALGPSWPRGRGIGVPLGTIVPARPW